MTDDVQEQPKSNVGGITGKGFMPGRSGNPGGRPRGSKSLVNLLIEALRKKTRDAKGNEREYYDLLTEAIVLNAAKGNAALVKLIFDYHEGPPPQKHEVTGVFYSGADLEQVLRQIAELMRDFVPKERWDEFAARLDELDAAGAA